MSRNGWAEEFVMWKVKVIQNECINKFIVVNDLKSLNQWINKYFNQYMQFIKKCILRSQFHFYFHLLSYNMIPIFRLDVRIFLRFAPPILRQRSIYLYFKNSPPYVFRRINILVYFAHERYSAPVTLPVLLPLTQVNICWLVRQGRSEKSVLSAYLCSILFMLCIHVCGASISCFCFFNLMKHKLLLFSFSFLSHHYSI